MFIHTVFFWTKPGTSPEAIASLVADCRGILSRIESVQQLHTGTPVPSARGVVDGSYSVGLTVIFDDAAGHDLYQPHPLHEQFIERNTAIWDRVVVYDYDASPA